ncbi:MAG: PucR family transcriptional regulator ligand-binding domain-containing protein [Clostridiaceae bacterium]
MAIMIKDILKLESLKKLKLVGGSGGLEKCIEWIYVAECFQEPLEGIKWLQGGELVFITGVGMKGDISTLAELIKGIKDRNGVGLIVNIGEYIENIPESAIKVADESEIPLFALPWEVKLVEVSKEISNAIILARIEESSVNQFLSNILFGDGELEENTIDKASYFGYNLEGKCCAGIIDIDKLQELMKPTNEGNEIDIAGIKVAFRKIVQEVFEKYALKVPVIDNEDSIIFIIRADENCTGRLEKALREIQDVISSRMQGLSVSVGIGNAYEDLKMMKQSLNEAELAIASSKCQGLYNTVSRYKEIGIYGLLFGVENKNILYNYYLSVLGPIVQKDKKHKDMTSLEVLETYLNENCNITSAAEKLFLHRNTLKYRIKKIEEELGYDLHNFDYCMKVKMALYIKNLLPNNMFVTVNKNVMAVGHRK